MTIPEGKQRLSNIPKEKRKSLIKSYGTTVFIEGDESGGYKVMELDGTVRDPLDAKGEYRKKVPLKRVFIQKPLKTKAN